MFSGRLKVWEQKHDCIWKQWPQTPPLRWESCTDTNTQTQNTGKDVLLVLMLGLDFCELLARPADLLDCGYAAAVGPHTAPSHMCFHASFSSQTHGATQGRSFHCTMMGGNGKTQHGEHKKKRKSEHKRHFLESYNAWMGRCWIQGIDTFVLLKFLWIFLSQIPL